MSANMENRQAHRPASRGKLLAALIGTAMLLCAALPALAQAEFEPIGEFGHGTAFGRVWNGELFQPDGLGGIAVNRASGDLYVADAGQARIDRLDSQGNFISAWGAGVITGGAEGVGAAHGDNSVEATGVSTSGSSMLKEVEVTSGGSFAVGQGISSAGISPGATVREITTEGGKTTIVLSSGASATSAGKIALHGSPYLSSVTTSARAFEIGQTIEGEGIPAGTKIAAIGAGAISLSQPPTMTKAADHLTVAEGAGNVPTNETQRIAAPGAGVAAFALTFKTPNPSPTEATTTSIPAAASAAEVQSALEGLSNIGAGNVGVTGSPGGPWTVEFTGPRFADTDVTQLATSGEMFATALGTQLTCTSNTAATTTEFQWLRNGAPIAGATSATYTTEVADAGKELQCQVTKLNANAGSTAVSNPLPVGSVPSPLPPRSAGGTTVNGTVAAGQTLTCTEGSWSNSPTAYAFQWYRNGAPIAGATSSTYLLSSGDVASPAVFQCVVTASNAGGSTAQASANRATSTAPNPAAPGGNGGLPNATLPALGLAIQTTRTGASAAEVCTVLAQCKAGDAEAGAGKLLGPAGIAVDQGSEDVYVLDSASNSSGVVQKFTAAGAFITAFGQHGSASPEQIETPVGLPQGAHGEEGSRNGIAVGSGGKVYVGDQGTTFGPRLAVFNSSGAYLESLGTAISEFGSPYSVATDEAGDVYVANVFSVIRKLSSSGQLLWKYEGESIAGMTADPASGDVFYSLLGGASKGNVVQLGAGGEKLGEFAAEPGKKGLNSLAFSPDIAPPGPPARPQGVFYGIDSKLEKGLIFGQSPVAPPQVKAESASGILETVATLKATVNQHGADITYRFQYGAEGPCSANPCAEAPAGGAKLASSKEDRTIGVSVAGLAPGTTYHYRVLATNASGTTEGEDETFTTFAAAPAGLPDGRAYELVSPPLKNGGEVLPSSSTLAGSCALPCELGTSTQRDNFAVQATAGGEGLAYSGTAFSGGLGSDVDEYASSRSASGWQTKGLVPADEPFGAFQLFSSDLREGVFYLAGSESLAPAPAGYNNLYLWRANGSPEPLVAEQPPNRPPDNSEGFAIQLGGANAGSGGAPGLSHLLFAANDALTQEVPGAAPAAPDPGAGQYDFDLYEWSGGHLSLVNVLPGNASVARGAGVFFGSGGSEYSANLAHAISDDGSRVFWSDSTGQLYVRVDADRTLEVPDHTGRFLTASSDGSRVLLNDGKLYGAAQSGTPSEAYEEQFDLTEGEGGFQGILGSSEDLSRVYFVDTKALTPANEVNANPVHPEHAEAGKDNLYAWHEGQLSFVGALLAADETLDFRGSDWAPDPIRRTADVSPDGRYLAFTSEASLTGYDNFGSTCRRGAFPFPFQPGLCAEVFLYDAATGKLVCASCNPTGQPPLGDSALTNIDPGITRLPLEPLHHLTDGGRVFFESQDILSPRDTNGKTQDVYEWEPQNGPEAPEADSCERAQGCLSLISSGRSDEDSFFLDATPSGRDAFFVTRARLVSQDPDELLDVYDARVGGGVEPPPASSECLGEACQAPVSPPNDATPASSSFAGSGNVVEAKKSKKAKKHRRHRHRARNRRHNRTASHHRGGAK